MFTCMVYLLHIASVSPKNKTASAALSLYSSTQLNSSSEIQCLQHPSQPSYWVSRALTVQITKGPQSRRQFTHCRRHTILYYGKCIQNYFKKTKLYRVEKVYVYSWDKATTLWSDTTAGRPYLPSTYEERWAKSFAHLLDEARGDTGISQWISSYLGAQTVRKGLWTISSHWIHRLIPSHMWRILGNQSFVYCWKDTKPIKLCSSFSETFFN